MARAKIGVPRSIFMPLIFAGSLFLSGSSRAITHGTEILKPAFFFSPLSYCAFQTLYQEKQPHEMGLKFFCTPFYAKNYSKRLIARGLGANTTPSINVAPRSLNGDLDSEHLIAVLTKNFDDPAAQHIDEVTIRPRATITLSPEQKEFGFQLVARHDLDFFIEGIFYSLEVAFVRQTRSINATYSNEFLQKVPTADIITIHNYFTGTIQSIYDPLQSLKLSDAPVTQHGVESVQATIGYNVLDKNDYRLALLASVQLPCGPEHSLEYLFSPNIGLKHLNFGFGWHGFLKLGGNDRTAWHLSNNAIGGYSFPADEARIPTIANMPWGHYEQMLANKTPAYTATTPGPDMLPHKIKVKRGLSLQNTFILTYKHDDLRLELGFSGGYQEAEHNALSKPWADGAVAIPNRYINPYNFNGASNNATPPPFTVDGKMYPATTGQLAESLPFLTSPADLTHGHFLVGSTEMLPVTSGAWAQPMATKVINNADLEINAPTIFRYQFFGSVAKRFTIAEEIQATCNAGACITFGEPSELTIRNYQLWVGLGFSF